MATTPVVDNLRTSDAQPPGNLRCIDKVVEIHRPTHVLHGNATW